MITLDKIFFALINSVVVILGKVEEMKARLLQLEQENTKVIARLCRFTRWDGVFEKGTGSF